MTQGKPAFDRFVILKNPASTNIRTAERYIAELRKMFPGATFKTIKVGRTPSETFKKLQSAASQLGPRTLLCIAGGDGTVNRVVSFLSGSKKLPAQARRTPLLPLWAGNANDFAHMLNGPAYRVRLPLLFKQSRVTPIYPLECRLADAGGRSQTYYAMNYAGFGATAAVAREINQSEHRRRWWQHLLLSKIIGEVATVGRIVMGSAGFTLEENGAQHSVFERSYINGTRMGRLQPFAASLTEKVFVQTTVFQEDKHVMAFYRWLTGNMRPAPSSKHNRSSTFTTKDSIWMQVDGEPVRVPKNTRITVRCSPIPLYALNTRLAPRRSRDAKNPRA